MVAFIILHYMALEETIACVESILNNVVGEKKIVVVDNASPNGSIDGLREKYEKHPDVDVLETGDNLGFAKGNNFGYKFAVEKYSPSFIVVMNNDMEITQKEFISGIYRSYEEYQYYIMGPDVYSTKKKYHQNPQTRPKPTEEEIRKKHRSYWIKDKLKFLFPVKWWIVDHFRKNQADIHQYDKRPYVQKVVINPLLHGSCYVFSPLFIEKHKEECFYNKTFMYMEAEILYYQATRDGEKMIYYPDIHVDHHEDVATDSTYKKQYKKSVFSVECMLQSTGAYLELIELDKKNNR